LEEEEYREFDGDGDTGLGHGLAERLHYEARRFEKEIQKRLYVFVGSFASTDDVTMINR
jgi:hypothetical protein